MLTPKTAAKETNIRWILILVIRNKISGKKMYLLVIILFPACNNFTPENLVPHSSNLNPFVCLCFQ